MAGKVERKLRVAVGVVLRFLRVTLRYSQEDLAKAAGVSRNTLAKVERADTNVTLHVIVALTDTSGVDVGSALALITEVYQALEGVRPGAQKSAAENALDAAVKSRLAGKKCKCRECSRRGKVTGQCLLSLL